MSGWHIIIIVIVTLVISHFVEVVLRKWLDAGKFRWKRVSYTKYDTFMNFLFTMAFIISSSFFSSYTEPYFYLLLTVYTIITLGFDAILAKRYDNNPKEYKVIIITGSLTIGLFLSLVTVANHLL